MIPTAEVRHKMWRQKVREELRDAVNHPGRSYVPGRVTHMARHRRALVNVSVVFGHLRSEGLVSMETLPDDGDCGYDDLAGDMFDPDVNNDIHPNQLRHEERKFKKLVDEDGVWFTQFWVAPDGQEDEVVWSLGGTVGELDDDYWLDGAEACVDWWLSHCGAPQPGRPLITDPTYPEWCVAVLRVATT